MDYILAFSAGLLSFLSPCVLPLIPLYFSYLIGSSVKDIAGYQARTELLRKSLFFTAGFSLIFIALGISVSAASQLFVEHMDLIRKIGGVVIIVLGLHLTGLFKINFLYMEKRLSAHYRAGNAFGALLLGMAFAVGWTPCIGPVLSSILIYAGTMDTIGKGTALLVMYSLGFSVPILLAAMFVGQFTRYLKKISKYVSIVSVVSGVILVIMGILVFTNRLEVFSQYGSLFRL